MVRRCYPAGMLQSGAAIFLCSVAPASCFAPRLPHVGNAAASFALTHGESRWTSSVSGPRRGCRTLRCSISRDEAIHGFDPLGFGVNTSAGNAQGPLHVPDLQGRRGAARGGKGAARHSLHATKRSIADEAQATRRRRGVTEDGLHAIKRGVAEVGVVYTDMPLEEEDGGSSGVVKGWDYWKYRALLLGVALLWGTNFPAVKFVEQHAEVSDATAAFVRFSLAAGVSLPFADLREKEVLFAGMEIGAWVALGYFTQAIGLQTSDASVCAFLCSLTVVVVPLLDAVTGKGIKRVTVAASFLALLGTGFLELGDAHASLNDLWCVAQAVGFGVAFTRIEHYMEKFPGKSLQLSIGQLISVAALTGLWCAYSTGGHLPDLSFMKDPPIAAALAYTGLVTTSLAIWLETICLEQVPAAEMSVIFSTEPLWATLVSGVFLKETMGPNALVGAGVILLACLVAQSEQIVQLMGRGGDKGDNDPLIRSDTGTGFTQTPQHEGQSEESEDLVHLTVFDEVDPAVESEPERLVDVPTVQEYTLPAGEYLKGSPSAESRGSLHSSRNNVPAGRADWFGCSGPE